MIYNILPGVALGIELLPAIERWIVAVLSVAGIYGPETFGERRGAKFRAKCPAVRLRTSHTRTST